ncbi:MAG: IniB N-terminal domain-containing protein [Pseudonocardia sp.]
MTFDDIIDFLLSLLRDDEAQAAFEADPEGTLAAAGLTGVTGQDVRDARLHLTDSGAVAAGSAPPPPGGADPVQEISYTTRSFTASSDGPGFTTTFVDQSTTITVDDRDITVQDAFNETTVVQDSFNTGSFNTDSLNTDDDVVAIQDNSVDSSVDNSVVTNDVTAIQDNDTVVNDNDVIDIVDNDVINEPPPEPAVEPADVPETAVDEPADPLADAAAV